MPNYEYQRFMAEVTENKDPLFRGRIAVKSFDFTGDDDSNLLDHQSDIWVEPAFDWGWFYVPDVGELVEIEILVSDPGDVFQYQSSVMNPKIFWRGKRFPGDNRSDTQTGARPVPSEFKTGYKRRGFSTPMGHILYFDDTPGGSRICLSWKEGSKIRSILLDKNAFSFLVDSDGFAFTISGKDSDASSVIGDGAVKVAIANHLESFYSTAVTGMKAIFDNHIHPTGMGPSGKSATQFPTWDSGINSSRLTIPDN